MAIFFLSTLTRSTFGFGDALVNMPLLIMLIGLGEARPLGALMSVVSAIFIVGQDWRRVLFPTVLWLILAALVGIAVGNRLLAGVDPRAAKATLALAIIGFALYNLVKPRLKQPIAQWWAWPAGFVAGTLSITFNMPGPPLVVFGTQRQWPAESFRATLQGYFLPTGTIVLLTHASDGKYDARLLWMFLFSLPMVLLAIPLGRRLNHLLRGRHFDRYVYALLIVMGMLLLGNVVGESWPGVKRPVPQTPDDASIVPVSRAARPC